MNKWIVRSIYTTHYAISYRIIYTTRTFSLYLYHSYPYFIFRACYKSNFILFRALKNHFLAVFLLTFFDIMLKYPHVCQQANVTRPIQFTIHRVGFLLWKPNVFFGFSSSAAIAVSISNTT